MAEPVAKDGAEALTAEDDATRNAAGPAQVRVAVSPDELELSIDILWQHGTSGVEERSAGAVIELSAGFPRRTAAETAAAELRDRVSPQHLEVETVNDDTHLDVWRSTAEPIDIGRITLHPQWIGTRPAEVGPRIVLSIDPGRAFGLGNHPTTKHVLHELQTVVSGGERVLDVGCGSGVLAIAALRLGAAEALGIDLDPEAIKASRENAAHNGVETRLRLSSQPLEPRTGSRPGADAQGPAAYDIVVANIGAATLLALEPALRSWCSETATVVLSGLLDEQADRVLKAYERDRRVSVSTRSTDGWTTLTLAAEPR